MSAAAIQRVIVRMLVDPSFAEAFTRGLEVPELEPHERAWLVAVDPRAFRTDPHRASRLLAAILDEAPTTAAVVADGGRQAERCFAFFRSPAFHDCIQHRGVLSLAFLAWAAAWTPELSTFELGAARARRRTPPTGSGVCVAGGVAWATLPTGTFLRWQTLRARLGTSPAEALVNGVSLAGLPAVEAGAETLVFQVGPQGLVVGELPDVLATAFDRWMDPVPRAVACADLRALGADPGDEDGILAGLVSDGLIVVQGGGSTPQPAPTSPPMFPTTSPGTPT
jgi:hypothetical protein